MIWYRPGRWGLRAQLLVLICSLLAVILLILGVGGYTFVYQIERDAWRGRQREAALSVARQVADVLARAHKSLDAIATFDHEVAHNDRFLHTLLEDQGDLVELVIANETGNIEAVYSSRVAVLSNLFTLAQARWFQEARDGTQFAGEIQYTAQDEPYIILARPAQQNNVVAARLHLTVLGEALTSTHIGRTGQAYVIDATGKIIGHSNPDVISAGTTLAGRPELGGVQAGDAERPVFYRNYEGRDVAGLSVAVPETSWRVVVEIDQAEQAGASRLALLLLGGGLVGLGLLATLLLTWRLNRLLLRPMEQLRVAAEGMSQGNLSCRVGLSRHDEVGRVAQAFDSMAQSLQDRERELRTLAASLEQQVEERTTALRAEAEERARLQDETLRQARALMELSTPLIPVHNQILVLPLIGVIDTQRAQQLLATVLQGLEQHRARFVVLDVTGVPLIDTQVAGVLLQADQGARLLGAQVIITGIRPEIAQSLVGLGVDLRTLATHSTLQGGIGTALHSLGRPGGSQPLESV